MKRNRTPLLVLISTLVLLSLACQAVTGGGNSGNNDSPSAPIFRPEASPTPLPERPVVPGEAHPDEPTFVTGEIPYTSPFFLNSASEPFVMLEDQAGFVQRDEEFVFRLESQTIGPVEVDEQDRLTFGLPLPAVPQGTLLDVDNDEQSETGVQIFAIAYWSNTWGGPFLEERDGHGWSTAYASTVTDPEQEGEIVGGTLMIWAPDDQQAFPSDFGADGKLFTADDPSQPVPAGYSLVDLDERPFRVYKEARPHLELVEGAGAVKDYSSMSYTEAFEALFEKVAREYPFTEEKGVNWQALHDRIAPEVEAANSPEAFYRAIRDLVQAIPDGHAGMSFSPDVFFPEAGGGLGLTLVELSDGRVIVGKIIPGGPAEQAGLAPGTEIVTWNGTPMGEAINQVTPLILGPASTPHHLRQNQIIALTRMPQGEEVTLQIKKTDGATEEIKLEAVGEVDSFLMALTPPQEDALDLPIEAEILEDSGLGYFRISTFSDDYNLMARLWESYLQKLVDNEIPGLIIDLRSNGGGSSGLANDFAGYFFDDEIELYNTAYYNDVSGKFEFDDVSSRLEPGPFQYEGKIAVLVGPYCASACEGFAYALSQQERAIVVGHYPTAGMYGEVGLGQYKLPDDITLQFPTGRPETPAGELLIEGTGVVPDVVVPVTLESALGQVDAVLQAAIDALK